MELNIQHDKIAKRFFAVIDDQVIELNYSSAPNGSILNYYRTFVPPDLRGHSLGEKVVIYALDYARENNYKIIPSCPFVERIISRHPEYKSLVASVE